MNSVPSSPAGEARAPLRIFQWSGGAVLFLVVAYFLFTRIPIYLNLTPESYGPYFWPRVSWLLPHVLFGLAATLLGPLQFWSRIRRDHIRVHRMMGAGYLLSVAFGGIAGLGLAATSGVTLTYAVGLATLSVAWLTTSGMAFGAIRRRNITQHKQWMIRSYVVTLAFVTFRVFEDLMIYLDIGSETERLTLMSWACWAIPLLFTEVVLQARSAFRGR